MPQAITLSRRAGMLMPNEKMCREPSIDARAAAGTQEKVDGGIKRRSDPTDPIISVDKSQNSDNIIPVKV